MLFDEIRWETKKFYVTNILFLMINDNLWSLTLNMMPKELPDPSFYLIFITSTQESTYFPFLSQIRDHNLLTFTYSLRTYEFFYFFFILAR